MSSQPGEATESPASTPTAAKPSRLAVAILGARRAIARNLASTFGVISERLGHNFREFLAERQPLIWVLAALVGVAVGYAALGFRLAIGVFQLPWLWTASERVVSAAAKVPWWNVLLAPMIGGLIVGFLLERFVSGRRAHAVADVIEARALRDCRIDVRTGLWSAFLAALSLGSGASLGREGPVVHLGAMLASSIEDRFRLTPASRRALFAAGVAAAVSSSFNAPIAGVLFAHEVILGHYALRALVPIVIASVAGGIVSRLHFGNFAAFAVPEYQITTYWEFPAFVLLGVTCATVAVLFQVAIMLSERVVWRFDMPLWLRTGLGGLAVGAIALVFPEVLGVGYETTDQALYRNLPLAMLLMLIVAKTAATAISMSVRFAGGVFSPSLYLGATTGAAFGIIATSTFPDVGASHGLYAILGMGAVAASVLGAPLSTTLICFELTGGYSMTIALLLTVSISVALSQAVLGQSFFHWQLGKRGLFLQEGPHKSIMRRLMVSSFMTAAGNDEASATRLDPASGSPWLLPSDTLERALRAFDTTGAARIAVVSEADTTVVIGHAERIQALNAFNRALIDATVEEHR